MDDLGRLDILDEHPERRRRLTVAEYHRLGELGFFADGERVELIEGQLAIMSPIGRRHGMVLDALSEMLADAIAKRATVRVQGAIVLDDTTEPNPDITVYRRGWKGYPGPHPGPDDILLLVEVSDTTLRYDRGGKLRLYARAGIVEVWIVDLQAEVVLVNRRPEGDGYASVATVGVDGVVEVEALPGVVIEVGPVFEVPGGVRS